MIILNIKFIILKILCILLNIDILAITEPYIPQSEILKGGNK